MANWPTGPQPQTAMMSPRWIWQFSAAIGAAAPDGDDVAPLDLAVLGCHVPRREDVGQEQDLLVRQAIRDLERADVGVGHAGVLGLAPGVPTKHVRVAEDAGRRMPPQRLGHPRVRVGVLTDRIQPSLTGPAVTACN